MAIKRLDLNKHEELNLKVYTLCKHTSWDYGRIAQELGLSKLRVIYVVKRKDGGDIQDVLCSRHPTKTKKAKKKRISKNFDKNPRLIF